jgi:MoxR-like ATPase
MAFGDLLACLKAGVNVLMVGPAGSGKTTGAMRAAAKLGLPFYGQSVCAQSSKSDLAGYMDAGGSYRGTCFRKAYETGGVFLLDEMDAGNPNVLVVLNAAIANGEYIFPDGQKVVAHKDFRCVAAANTWGQGADRQYIGRNQLDAATLDRFVKLSWDYDERHEMRIAPNADWTRYVQKVRAAVMQLRLRVVVSPRASITGGNLLNAGMARSRVAELVLWGGIDEGTKDKLDAALKGRPA